MISVLGYTLNLIDLVTIAIAIWGAGLSTYIWIHQNQNMVEATAYAYYAEPYWMTGNPKPETPDAISFRIVNKGFPAVQIADVFLRMDDKSKVYISHWVEDVFPAKLERGDRVEFSISIPKIATAIIEDGIERSAKRRPTAIFVQDTLENKTKVKLPKDIKDALPKLEN